MHALFVEELFEMLWIGSGKSGIDRLVGVPNTHPVPIRSGKQPKDAFLRTTRVLRLILQDKRPTMPEARQQPLVQLQREPCQADQVVKVHPAAIVERPLIVCIDLGAHRCQSKLWAT